MKVLAETHGGQTAQPELIMLCGETLPDSTQN